MYFLYRRPVTIDFQQAITIYGANLIIFKIQFISSESEKKRNSRMSDIKSEIDSDIEQNFSINSNVDPKNMQELSIYVSMEFLVNFSK